MLNKQIEKKRPIGITLIVILLAIYSLFLFGLSVFVFSSIIKGIVLPLSQYISMGILFLIVGFFSIISAFGLFKLKNWARLLSIFLFLFLLIKLFFNYITGQSVFSVIDLVYILILLIAFFYLILNKEVKSAFKKIK